MQQRTSTNLNNFLHHRLNELIELTRNLNDKIEEFVETYRVNKELESIDTSNSGDQRHFFKFPETEQFKCSIPRPAENLIFENGQLSTYRESCSNNEVPD